jgi:hypothetical protein
MVGCIGYVGGKQPRNAPLSVAVALQKTAREVDPAETVVEGRLAYWRELDVQETKSMCPLLFQTMLAAESREAQKPHPAMLAITRQELNRAHWLNMIDSPASF